MNLSLTIRTTGGGSVSAGRTGGVTARGAVGVGFVVVVLVADLVGGTSVDTESYGHESVNVHYAARLSSDVLR